jgi:hypothetical protein
MTRSLKTTKGRRFRASGIATGIMCALGAAACGSSPAASGPSWAKYLGAGVTVVAPGNASAPGALVTSYIAVLNGNKVSEFCQFVEPAEQPTCHHALAGVTSTGGETIGHFHLGYVAVDGNRALVGLTGTNCDPNAKPRCDTNTDPAALFSSDRSFASLYTEALAAQNTTSSANTYSLAPCVQVNAKWYINIPTSDL